MTSLPTVTQRDASVNFLLPNDHRAVDAWYQRIVSKRPDRSWTGELLARPAGVDDVAKFFAQVVSLDDSIALLRWQMQLVSSLSSGSAMSLSVNVDPGILNVAGGCEQFEMVAAESPCSMVFEFTETSRLPTAQELNPVMSRLRALGHRFALDDFGVGCNGFGTLFDYGFDCVKIDRHIIADLDERPDKQRVLELLSYQLRILKLGHVVEGVESDRVRLILIDLGFTCFQGFFFHRPEPVEEEAAATRGLRSPTLPDVQS